MKGVTDELDRKLVAELVKDSSQSTTELSSKLNITRQTVASRISRLKKYGILNGFKAKIGYESLGFSSCFVLFLKLGDFDQALLAKALEEFRSSPHVILDASVTGEWDVVQVLAFKNTREYDEYVARIRTKYARIFRDSKSHAILKFFKTPDEFVPEI